MAEATRVGAADVVRTGRGIVAGTWGCAVIVMVGSATNAALAYDHLGDQWALGLALGIAVDIALCVALVGDRRLYAHGLSSSWGRALRVTTAVMSLVLNTAVPLTTGRYLLAFLHAFLPVLLVVLTEYGQDVLLEFTAIAGPGSAEESTTHHEEPMAPVPIAPEATGVSVTRLGKPRQATAADRRQWIESRIIAGHRVTGIDVERQFGSKNGAREVAQVRSRRRDASRGSVKEA